MNLPKQCGKMYIKFDKDNQPEYGFEVSYNEIKKFVPLSDKEIHTIILPKLVESSEFDMSNIDENSPCISSLYFKKQIMKDYISGSVKISDTCFKGVKKCRIIVPFENSIMLDWGSFDENAEIELILPKNLTLKQIYRTFDTGFDYEHENWTVIADKKISGQFSFGAYGSDDYSIAEYAEEDLDYKVANFTITHYTQKENNIQNVEGIKK